MELHDVFNLVLGGGEAIFKLPVLPLKAVFNLAAWATAAAAEFIKLSGKIFPFRYPWQIFYRHYTKFQIFHLQKLTCRRKTFAAVSETEVSKIT
uniref:Uncharacterized protein n=1 Tax=Glossina palpalis gambiensis TaxID=67801 RepID=A0A1B0B358_9MUSC